MQDVPKSPPPTSTQRQPGDTRPSDPVQTIPERQNTQLPSQTKNSEN